MIFQWKQKVLRNLNLRMFSKIFSYVQLICFFIKTTLPTWLFISLSMVSMIIITMIMVNLIIQVTAVSLTGSISLK